MPSPLSEFDLLADEAPAQLKAASKALAAEEDQHGFYLGLKAILSEEDVEKLKGLLETRYRRGLYAGARQGIFAERERILRAQRAVEGAPTPAPSDWDYQSSTDARGPRAEDTDAAGVAATARTVEEYVNRVGPVQKGDVSCAFPHLAPLLSAAYRHLHESRRIEVCGQQLRPWPKGEGHHG